MTPALFSPAIAPNADVTGPIGAWVCCNRSTQSNAFNSDNSAPPRQSPAPQPARGEDGRAGAGFNRPSLAGPHHSHAALQPGVHVLQRVRRFLEAGAAGGNVPAHR